MVSAGVIHLRTQEGQGNRDGDRGSQQRHTQAHPPSLRRRYRCAAAPPSSPWPSEEEAFGTIVDVRVSRKNKRKDERGRRREEAETHRKRIDRSCSPAGREWTSSAWRRYPPKRSSLKPRGRKSRIANSE